MERKWKEAALLLRKDEDLSCRSSLSSGGRAELFAEPRSLGELHSLLKDASGRELRISVLGSGTHTIIPDSGVSGLVVSTRALRGLRRKGAVVTCGPGDSLDSVINFAIDSKLKGLGSLGGFPGTAGGAVALDAEANGTRLRDLLLYVDILARGGRFIRREGRHFHLNDDEIITGLSFRLRPTQYTAEARKRKEGFVEETFIPPCPRYIGPVFRNPAAGDLIRAFGLTGPNGSRAEFSSYQANYIFTYPGCTSREVQDLIEKAERTVPEALERNIVILGDERKTY